MAEPQMSELPMAASKMTPPTTDVLLNILVTLLTPLFLGGPTGNGDFNLARAAAMEMLRSFRIRNAWDLLTAVQTVGFAMAALGSLGLSMADDLSSAAVLRCRSNANALQRSSDRAQERLDRRAGQPDVLEEQPLDVAELAESFRQAAEAQFSVMQARARAAGEGDPARPGPTQMDASRPDASKPDATGQQDAAKQDTTQKNTAKQHAGGPASARPASAGSVHPALSMPGIALPPGDKLEQESNIVWASAMATVAQDLAKGMGNLPLAEQRAQQIRIDALRTVSKNLTEGTAPGPNDLAGLGLAATPRAQAV